MVKTKPAAAPRYQAMPADDACLAFANTRYWRGRAEPTETLNTADDVLNWATTEGGADPALAAACGAAWAKKEAEVLACARSLRESLYQLFANEGESRGDCAWLNEMLGAAPARLRLSPGSGRAAWQFEASPSVVALLAPVIWSAGDLLTSTRLGRVRTCANPECRFLFLDDSKAGTRRWCSMSACGNRAKAHRHYQRRRGKPA